MLQYIVRITHVNVIILNADYVQVRRFAPSYGTRFLVCDLDCEMQSEMGATPDVSHGYGKPQAPRLVNRLCERQNKGTQSKAIFGRHLDKVDPIPYLRILRCDDCLCADPLSFQRKHDFQLRTYIHREHTFDVATAKADFVGSSAQRGYARAL